MCSNMSAILCLFLLIFCFTAYVSDEIQNKLAVAHFIDGNVEIIQPLKITNTHVILEVQGLSPFGLIKWLIGEKPIIGQILLFYKEINRKKKKRTLQIYLLAGNVLVEEVITKLHYLAYFLAYSRC